MLEIHRGRGTAVFFVISLVASRRRLVRIPEVLDWHRMTNTDRSGTFHLVFYGIVSSITHLISLQNNQPNGRRGRHFYKRLFEEIC
jgi:hypothetical protein